MSTLADRLREAIPENGIRAFQREMRDRGVKGSSYAMVHRYLAGEADPPAEFVVAAADVLGVGPGWLLADEGPKAKDEHPELLEGLAEHAAAQLLPLTEDRDLVMNTFLGALRRIMWSLETEPEHEQVRRLAELFVDVVKGPSQRLLFPSDMRTITDHYVAMLHAMMLLFPPWRSVESIETIISKLEATDG